MPLRPTGLLKRGTADRAFLAEYSPYNVGELLRPTTVIQTVFAVHDQKSKPSCVGHAYTAGLEAHMRRHLSAVGLWTDCRRLDGSLADPSRGTWSSTAIRSLIARGVEPMQLGEDERPTKDDTVIASLECELAADVQRVAPTMIHRCLSKGDRLPYVVDALQRGYAVCMGDGLRAPYFSLAEGEVATERHMNHARENGHEQRIFGYITPEDARFDETWRGCFLVQNSWGYEWGGFRVPCEYVDTDGRTIYPGSLYGGCALVAPQCVENAWDVDTLQVTA